jgi:beta-lactamase regulating signal transducer with metallopeptidase domain
MRIVLDNSVAFSLLFAGVWLVKKLFGKQLSARLHYTIWAAVIISLLMPVRIESGISLWNLLPKQTAESIIRQTDDLRPQNEIESGSGSGGDERFPSQEQPSAAADAPSGRPAVTGQSEKTQDNIRTAVHLDLSAFLRAAWLAGAAITALRLFAGGLWLRRRIVRCGCKTPSWLESCAEEFGNALNMRLRVRIIVQPVLPTPAVMGIFHPILAMPESVVKEGSRERIRHILTHELNHVRRGDLFVIALLNLLCSIYWFNPVTWLCFRLIRADMESSCDSDAISALGVGLRQEYIRTLVYFSGIVGRSRAQAALSLNDAGIKMKKRIGAMFMTKKTKPAIAVPVILLVLVLMLAASATGCLPAPESVTAFADLPAASDQEQSSSAPASEAANLPGAGMQTPKPSPSPSAAPDTVSQIPVTTPETPAPAEFQWENEYKPVLDKYREFAARISQSDSSADFSDMDDPWSQIAPDAMMSTRNFGYALRDMDSNGTPELFLLTSDGSVWAMYTFIDGSAKLLGTFWPRNSCVLDSSDIIYINWSNGAFDNGRDAYRMSKDGRELEFILRVAMESADETGNPLDKPRYYKCVGSKSNKEIIGEAEADEEISKFPDNNDNSGLEFIPLG